MLRTHVERQFVESVDLDEQQAQRRSSSPTTGDRRDHTVQ
jgi:hypothetical protein